MPTSRRGLVRQFDDLGAPLVLAIIVGLLSYHFGGYYARSWSIAALVLAIWAVGEGVRGRLPALRSPAGYLLGLGVLLTAFTALSMTWAYFSSHAAWEEAGRTFLYLTALTVGAATCAAARVWARTATWFGVALAAVAASTLVRMAYVTNPQRLFSGYRVDAPIGYVNGLAAVCALGALLLLGQAIAVTRPRLSAIAAPHQPGTAPVLQQLPLEPRDLAVRALAAGACIAGATGCACLLLMVQSRGSVAAGAVALVVALALVPLRLRFAGFLALVAIGAYSVHAALDRPFVAVGDLIRSTWELNDPRRGPLTVAANAAIRGAGRHGLAASIATGLVGAGIAATLMVLQARRARAGTPAAQALAAVGRPGRGGLPQLSERAVVGLALLVIVVACLIPVGGHRSAADWARTQASGCLRTQPKIDTSALTRTSHLADVGTNRCDFWRVALHDLKLHPLNGVGAGNFQGTYAKYGHSTETPKQTHSLPLQFAAELGLVGVVLSASMLAIVLWAAWQFARSGRERDPVFAVGIAAIAYWLAHSSIDWLWTLPGVTLPIMVLAGGLVACLSPVQKPAPRAGATVIAAGLSLFAIAAIAPVGYGDWQLKRAQATASTRAQVTQRLAAAKSAASTDTSWALPHMQEAELLLRLNDVSGARREALVALKLEPRNVIVHNRALLLGGNAPPRPL